MRPWGGVRTHQPEVRRSCGPGPGRGAVGCSAKAAAPEAGAGRGPRGGHSLARTAGPAPRGRGRRPGLLSLTAREGEPGLGGVGGPGTPNEPKTPGPAFKALQPRSEHPQPVSAAAGSRCPTGTAAPARPRAPPRVWASRWRLAWRAGPVTSSLLSPPFPPLFLLASPSRLLACQTACCLPADGPDPRPPSLPPSFTVWCF